MSKIVNAPNPVLTQKAKPVDKIDKVILAIIEEMKTALLSAADPIGVGLAAPQIGKSLCIFITKPASNSPITVFVNPEIIENDPLPPVIKQKSKKSQTKLEGCLSLPNIWGEVARHPTVKITYLNGKGKKITRKFRGLMATIVQHEIDHLDGGLFPKRVLEQQGALYKSKKNEKGEDVFEEIEI